MSHFPPFYNDFLLSKFNFKDWIFHFEVTVGDQNYAHEME